MRGLSLFRTDLSGQYLANINFARADLRMSDLSNTDFSDSNFFRANLQGSNLANALFVNNNLSQENLSETYFFDKNAKWGRIKDTIFKNVDLRGADFSKAETNEVHIVRFISSDLREANFADGKLWVEFENSDLSGADLRRLDTSRGDITFKGSNLTSAYLQGANITCSKLTEAKYWQMAYRDESLACGAPIPDLP